MTREEKLRELREAKRYVHSAIGLLGLVDEVKGPAFEKLKEAIEEIDTLIEQKD
ncbi:hypothetical protein [Roseibium alexandrii]|uniref:hypothetical protein n=1 Tax=Roseibium alexandrii TaxID=388408 RepID=UPI003753B266